MNSLDVILAVVIIIFTVRGVFRGLVTEFIVLSALILGYILAFTYLQSGINLLLHFFPGLPEFAARILSFVLIFLIINIILRMIGRILNRLIKYVFLKSVNRLAGGAFAFIKIVLIISLILILIGFIPFSAQALDHIGAGESKLYLPIRQFAPQVYKIVISVLPGGAELHQKVIHTLQQADSTAKDIINPFK